MVKEENIESLSSRLGDAQVVAEVGYIVDEYTHAFEFGGSVNFLRGLEKAVQSSSALSGDAKNFYLQAVTQLKIASFPRLSLEEQKNVLKNSVVYSLKKDIDLKQRVYLNFSLSPLEQNQLKEQRDVFVRALEENEEALTAKNVQPAGDGQVVQIKNLVLDYKNYSRDKQSSAYSLASYLSSSQNAKLLSGGDAEILRKALSLYDWLRFDALKITEEAPEPVSPEKISFVPPAAAPAPRFAPRPQVLRPAASKFSPTPLLQTPKPQSQPPRAENRFTVRPATKIEMMSSQSEVDEINKKIAILQKSTASPEGLSLSQAIINAGADTASASGDIRFGKREPAKPQVPTPPKPNGQATPSSSNNNPTSPVAPQAPNPATPKPLAPVQAAPLNPKSDIAPTPELKSTILQETKPTTARPEVLDLSKAQVVDLDSILSPSDLQKLKLQDLRSVGFENSLQKIKQKVRDFAAKQNLPVKDIATSFYRSPAYALYITMGVAVMNDTSSDQKMAFDKVVNNYQAAKKEYLTREEFLSLNRLKKELNA